MTPDTDPGQTPEPFRPVSGVTPGKGLRVPEIDLAVRRHPSMRAVPRIPLQPVERTLSDEEIERGARIVGMTDASPRHREGPPVRKRDAARDAVARFFGGGR